MDSWHSRLSYLLSLVMAASLWHAMNLWEWDSRERTRVGNINSISNSYSFHRDAGTQSGPKFMSLLCEALRRIPIPLLVEVEVLQWSARLCALCPLPALLRGPHCLSFFPSPLRSSHPCLLANLPLACQRFSGLRAFASAVLFYLECSFPDTHSSQSLTSFKSLNLSVGPSLTTLRHYKYRLSPLPSHILKNPFSPCHEEQTAIPRR